MAAKTPRTARLGCLIAGCLTFVVGIPFSYLGAIIRTYYGPDTIHAEFETDTCSAALTLPTCGQWLPDPNAFIMLLTHQAPQFVGAWCLIGIVAASMSTSDGAILAMGTVSSHNLMRNIGELFPRIAVSNDNLLMYSRYSTVPFTLASTLIAAYYRSSHSSGATGYLLIVAFDIVFATVVVPLFGCFYTKHPRPNAALFAILSGAITRIVLEFALPKDGFLILPFDGVEFLDYGGAANTLPPSFIDAEEVWDPADGTCDQDRFRDYTGVDSITSFLVCLTVFVTIQFLERNGPLFVLPGMIPYEKKLSEDDIDDYEDEVDGKAATFGADETELQDVTSTGGEGGGTSSVKKLDSSESSDDHAQVDMTGDIIETAVQT